MNLKSIYTKWKYLIQKATNVSFIYMTFWKTQNYRDINEISGFWGKEESLQKRMKKLFEMMEIFCISIVVITYYICQTHQKLHT